MKTIFALVLVLSLTGCALTNNGTWDFDLVVNVDIAKDIIRASVGIGLPLALEKLGQDEISKHASAVSVATSGMLAILENDTKQLDQDAVNNLLSGLDGKLASASERHAIQSAITLIMSLIARTATPHEHISPEVREVLTFFIREVRNVYELYVPQGGPTRVLGVNPLRFEKR